jgi:hypothetical protein
MLEAAEQLGADVVDAVGRDLRSDAVAACEGDGPEQSSRTKWRWKSSPAPTTETAMTARPDAPPRSVSRKTSAGRPPTRIAPPRARYVVRQPRDRMSSSVIGGPVIALSA